MGAKSGAAGAGAGGSALRANCRAGPAYRRADSVLSEWEARDLRGYGPKHPVAPETRRECRRLSALIRYACIVVRIF